MVTPLILLLFLLIFPGPKAQDAAPASNILIRVTGTLLALYAVAAPVTFPTGISPEIDFANSLLKPMSWAGLLVIPMIFLRPAFAIVPAALVLSGKSLATVVMYWALDGHLAWQTHLGGVVAGLGLGLIYPRAVN